jgi:hypothetical protein
MLMSIGVVEEPESSVVSLIGSPGGCYSQHWAPQSAMEVIGQAISSSGASALDTAEVS